MLNRILLLTNPENIAHIDVALGNVEAATRDLKGVLEQLNGSMPQITADRVKIATL